MKQGGTASTAPAHSVANAFDGAVMREPGRSFSEFRADHIGRDRAYELRPGNWATYFGSVTWEEAQCDEVDLPKSRSSAF